MAETKVTLVNGVYNVEFPAENGGRYTGRIADGVYSATAKVKAEKAKDGQAHTLPFAFKATPKPKTITDFEYGCMFYALDLKARGAVENPFLVTPKLTPEEKEASKARAKVKRTEKAAQTVKKDSILAKLASMDAKKMSAADVQELIKQAVEAQAALAKLAK